MNEPKKREIKSYVLRQGRLTQGQTRAFTAFWDDYGLDLSDQVFDFKTLFNQQQPVYLEIGFGDGDSLAKMASDRPHQNFIGVEVHKPGVGHLLMLADQFQLANLKVMNADAIEVLAKIPANSLAGVMLFFPDPWQKRKHRKRRILKTAFINEIIRVLKSQGTFHLATDWQDYAKEMLVTLDQVTELENTAGQGNYIPRPDFRPLTKFEARGHRLNHQVWDLIYTLNSTKNPF